MDSVTVNDMDLCAVRYVPRYLSAQVPAAPVLCCAVFNVVLARAGSPHNAPASHQARRLTLAHTHT